MQYLRNIIAADVPSAVFLANYIRKTTISRKYADALEVFDLQKYKVISKPAKVRVALRERSHIPFIFVSGKN